MLSTQFITHILLNLNKLFCIIYLNLYLFFFMFAFVGCLYGFKNTRTVFTETNNSRKLPHRKKAVLTF